MNIEEMLKIIELEQLEVYTKFVYGSLYIGGEYTISFLKEKDGVFRICAIGEKGKVIFDERTTDENYACQRTIEHMRKGKIVFSFSSDVNSSYNRAK